MTTGTRTIDWQATQLGILSGMRSTMGWVALTSYLTRTAGHDLPTPLDLLASPTIAMLSKLALLGEMGVDKAPFVPDRISPGPLAGRAIFGALTGGVFARSQKQPVAAAAGAGALSAIASTWIAYSLRRAIVRRLHAPDLLVALIEDAIVIGLALQWLRVVEG